MLYRINNKLVDVTTTSLAAATRTRGSAYRFYQTFTRVDAYAFSFFPSAIRLWNKSTHELVSQPSAESKNALIYCLTTQMRHILTKTDPNRHYITSSNAIVITARKYSTQIAGLRWANVSIWRWPNVGYPRWANVILLIGPTLAQLVGITLGQSGFVLHFRWANVGPMWLLHLYVVFSLGQRWTNVGLYHISVGPMLGQYDCIFSGLMHIYSMGVLLGQCMLIVCACVRAYVRACVRACVR